jgi:TonB family protein
MKQLIWPALLSLAMLTACGGKSSPPPETADNSAAADHSGAEGNADEAGPVAADEPLEEASPETEADAEDNDETAESTDEAAPLPEEAPAEDGPPPSANLEDYMGAAPSTPEYKTVQENMKMFKFCYLDAMRSNPDLQGTIRVRFTVEKAGKVKKAKAVQNELNKKVEKCVLKALKELQFPKRDSKRTVEYPFKFIPGP